MVTPIFLEVVRKHTIVVDSSNAKPAHWTAEKVASGRKPYKLLGDKIEKFWIDEVEKEPSHYDSVSTKQRCVEVSSMTHGFLIFLSKHFPSKYRECIDAQYFPDISVRVHTRVTVTRRCTTNGT